MSTTNTVSSIKPILKDTYAGSPKRYKFKNLKKRLKNAGMVDKLPKKNKKQQ
jgi:hypothetical protein